MNKLSVPAAFKDDFDELNVAVELGLAHRGWYIYGPQSDQTIFALNRATVAGMQLTETRLGHCIGRFDPRHVDSSFVCMGFTVSGVSAMEGPYGRITLQAGDVSLWHSSVPMNFHIQEPYHLLNLVFCDKYLKSEILDIPSVVGMHFRSHDPFGSILSGFMQGLLNEWQTLSESDLTLALLAARSLMVKAVQKKKGEQMVNPDAKRMTSAMRFIDQNLYDPELSPNKIATALHMSLRSLYLMFARENLTVQGFIRDRRLEDCRLTIASKRTDLSMKQLALSRGFNDLSGFSRAFKRKYGISPMEFQRWVATPLA
jgi:AraC-like DNA-binding protein